MSAGVAASKFAMTICADFSRRVIVPTSVVAIVLQAALGQATVGIANAPPAPVAPAAPTPAVPVAPAAPVPAVPMAPAAPAVVAPAVPMEPAEPAVVEPAEPA